MTMERKRIYKPKSNPPSILDQIVIELGLNAYTLSKRLGITYRMVRYSLNDNIPLQIEVAKRLQVECAKHGMAITLDEIYQEVPVWYNEEEVKKQQIANSRQQSANSRKQVTASNHQPVNSKQ